MVAPLKPKGVIYGNIFAFWNNLNNDVSIVMWRVAKPTDMIFENHKNQIKSDRLNFPNFFENGGEVVWIGIDTEPNLFFNWNYGQMYYGNSTIGIKQSIERYFQNTDIVRQKTLDINTILRPYIYRSPNGTLLDAESHSVYMHRMHNIIESLSIKQIKGIKIGTELLTKEEEATLDFYETYKATYNKLVELRVDLVSTLTRLATKAVAKELDRLDPDGIDQMGMLNYIIGFNAKEVIERALIELNIPLINS